MIIYLIFIIVGGLLLAGAIVVLKNTLTFIKNGERAIGTVVRLDERKDDEGTYYFPVFDIPTRQHETITYGHWTGSSSAGWRIGETSAFIFAPGKPDTVRFLNYWGIFWWPLCLMAVAVDLLVMGGGYFLLRGYFGA